MSSDILYVLGDQSLDLLPSIQQLSRRCRQNSALKEFMRSATDNIQRALAAVPAHLRPTVLPFDSPLALAEALETASGSTPLVSSLLAVSQLGHFIVYVSLNGSYEQHANADSRLSSNPCALDPSETPAAFLGICTGSLSAAAIASSRNLTELLHIAPHIVSLAFYVGLEAYKRTQSLEPSEASWATIVKDVRSAELQTILDDFNHSLGDRCHRRVYISAVGESSATVSGPPTLIRRLFEETSSLKHAKRLQLPVKAAFHARHLIPISHSSVFEHVDSNCFRRHLHHYVISPYLGAPYASAQLDVVLREIFDEILQRPIDWRTTTNNLSSLLQPSAQAIPIGPFVATSGLSKWLSPRCDLGLQGMDAEDGLRPAREGSAAIAIVGMSIRAPGSETLEEFWNILSAGQDLHRKIPADRFDVRTHCDPSGKTRNAILTPYGVFIDRPGYFDPRFFNMSPREAYQTDPQQRLMLLTTYEALENAGYSPNRTPSSSTRRIASFIGQTGDDYRECNASQDVDTYFITGNIRAFGPGRLNYHFGWEGPSFSIDTACSSSGASIHLACSSLLSRECDTAISGGANLLTSPDLFAGLSRGGFLSKTGGCKTFDKEADGYVRGEGCGVIVLKRLEDAVADRDNVLAVIRGATTNHSAEAVSITHPHEQTQERLFKAVLNDAGVLPHEVDVAEIHGTGTQAGDAIESRSVTNVLCQGRTSDNLLTLSTVKPNIGHAEAASGVTSVIKAVLMMQKNAIPPHIGIKRFINENLPPLGDINARVCSKESPFYPRANSDGKRRILINNFDAAGGNTSMLVEDPPTINIAGKDPRSHKVVAFSAKSPTALANNTRNMLRWLKTNPNACIDDIAYTSTSRRIHHPHRKAFAATSTEELIEVLERNNIVNSIRRLSGQPSVVFCFTGQGSQYISMAEVLYKTHSTFRASIDTYAELCKSHRFPSFLPVIEGDNTALESPVRVQLSIVAIELALAVLWNSWGIKASAVIGHSLGEYAALCHSGVLSVSDCFYLVGKRAQLIAETCTPGTHAMLNIQAPARFVHDTMLEVQIHDIEYACFNSPKSTVVCGPLTQIKKLKLALNAKNLSSMLLPTRYAFHSSQFDIILNQYQDIAQTVDYREPQIPVSSTLLGEVVSGCEIFGARYLKLQTRKEVRFQEAIEALHSASLVNEASVWIELGPTPNCLSLIKATALGARSMLPSLQIGRSDWQVLGSSLVSVYNAGLDIDWTEVNRPFELSLKLVQLPNYNFDLKNYWMYEGDTATPVASKQRFDIGKSNQIHKTLFRATESLHRVENEETDAEKISVVFAADTSRPALKKALRGHVVNGLAICPSSVYADMAYTAASYIRDLSTSDHGASIAVDNLEVTSPLIVHNDHTEQTIRLTVRKMHSSSEVLIEISSQDDIDRQIHATCTARLIKGTRTMKEACKNAYLIHSRIDQLHRASVDGKAHRLLRPIIYKLFKSFVDYSPEYQGLEEVCLNTGMLEAAANVTFRTSRDGFICSPYWIDSILHLSGFILNGTEFTPGDSVFISNGWKSLKFAGSLSSKKAYRSYVRMQTTSRSTIFTGDVYFFDGHDVIALCEGVKFQQIKRKILDHIMPTAISNSSRTPINKDIYNISLLSPSKGLLSNLSTPGPSYTDHTDAPSSTTKLEQIMAIIASESRLESSRLDENTSFQHLGIDGLMASQIVGKVAAETRLCFPASVFTDCKNVKQLRDYLDSTLDDGNLKPYTPSQTQMKISQNALVYTETADLCARAFEALAHELRIESSELDDNSYFVDLGVDSLLTISILSTMSSIVGEKLPASIFVEYPTVADFRCYLQAYRQPPCLMINNTDANYCEITNDDASLGQLDPATESSNYREESCLAEKSITTEILRKIVAEEVGICATEIDNDATLSDMGVDSLLSLPILSRIKLQTGMKLASNFFFKHPTFSDIEQVLSGTPTQQRSTEDLITTTTSIPRICANTYSSTAMSDSKTWRATSILLQDSSSCTEPCLFLIPDGSGSSGCYFGLPRLSCAGAVYGLNSPFLTQPESFDMPLGKLVNLYVAEMIRIQPRGPYHIGGWSVGGICAFEAASQLVRGHGQKVSSLILIDAPCPTILPPLPIEDVDFLHSVGVFETVRLGSEPTVGAAATSSAASVRDGIREHFAGTLKALDHYSASAVNDQNAPDKVIVLWAQQGVRETLDGGMGIFAAEAKQQHSQHPTTSWLMETRTSYGTCGWEELLPNSSFTCHTISGDHFSIILKPGVLEMGAKISHLL